MASCQDHMAWSSRQISLVAWMSVKAPYCAVFVHSDMIESCFPWCWRSIGLLVRDTGATPIPVNFFIGKVTKGVLRIERL